MKNKIIILLSAGLISTVAVAQNVTGVTGGSKPPENTNLGKEPMINGIPYSQYKAQVQAREAQQKQVAKPTVNSSTDEPVYNKKALVVAKPTKETVSQVKPETVAPASINAAAPVGNAGGPPKEAYQSTKPVPVQIEGSSLAPNPSPQKEGNLKVAGENAVNSTNTGLKIAPADKQEKNNYNPGSLGAITPAKPVAVETVQSKSAETPAATTKNLVPMPASSTNNELLKENPASETPSMRAPEVKIDNSNPVKPETVPASATNPAVKKPVASMQGAEKNKE